MSLEELITTLAREAEEEKEKLLREAEDEAGRILLRAREDVEKIGEGPKGEASRRLSSETARRLHASRIRGQNLIRQAQGKIMDSAAARTLELAGEFSRDADWAGRLEALLREAADGMSGGTVTVRPEDRQVAESAAAKLDGTFRVATAKGMAAGVKVASDDGLVEVDNTLPTRLRIYLSLNEAGVAAVLFSGSSHA